MSSELTEEFLKEEYSDEDWWVAQGYQNPEDVPVPDWHIAILEERRARYKNADTSKWRTWEEVERELLEKLAKPLKD